MIPYIDQLITRYVLLEDQSALIDLYRCIPAKYHVAHFSDQKKLFIPLISRLLSNKLKLEDQKISHLLVRNSTLKNITLLKIISEVFAKLNSIQANPIITSNFSNYLHGICKISERAFEEVCINVKRQKLSDSIQILKELGWKLSNPSHKKELKLLGKINFKFLDRPKVELRCDFFDKSYINKFIIGDVEIKTANPSFIFFTSCLNGLERKDASWIYDSVEIAQKTQLDWKLLTQLSREQDCSFTFLAILNFLNKHFSLEIPDNVISELKSQPLSFAQKIEKHSLSCSNYGAIQQLEIIIASFIRDRKRKNLSLSELPSYIDYKTQ